MGGEGAGRGVGRTVRWNSAKPRTENRPNHVSKGWRDSGRIGRDTLRRNRFSPRTPVMTPCSTNRPRIIDALLARNLCSIGAVLIEGPRACGKKTAARRLAKSELDLTDDTACHRTTTLLDMAPELVLGDQAGDAPRLIAEWQRVPRLWDEIRLAVDDRGAVGEFILTGSSVPADTSEILHSGTGRFARLRMRPMSLCESGYSTGAVSLEALFNGVVPPTDLRNPLSLEKLAALTCRAVGRRRRSFRTTKPSTTPAPTRSGLFGRTFAASTA